MSGVPSCSQCTVWVFSGISLDCMSRMCYWNYVFSGRSISSKLKVGTVSQYILYDKHF